MKSLLSLQWSEKVTASFPIQDTMADTIADRYLFRADLFRDASLDFHSGRRRASNEPADAQCSSESLPLTRQSCALLIGFCEGPTLPHFFRSSQRADDGAYNWACIHIRFRFYIQLGLRFFTSLTSLTLTRGKLLDTGGNWTWKSLSRVPLESLTRVWSHIIIDEVVKPRIESLQII